MGMVGLRDVFVVAPASSFHHSHHHHHHNHHHHHDPVISDPHSISGSNSTTALGVGVIPLLTATTCLAPPNISVDSDSMMGNRGRGMGIQLWQDQEPQQHSHYLKKHCLLEHNTSGDVSLVHGGSAGAGGIIASVANSGGSTCQDCGNQAKKDCGHRRCRTCCKSRGFECPTHVKSTWVPAGRRRERQLMAATAAAAAGSSGSTSCAKKPRLVASQTTTTSHTSTSNTTPPRSFDTSSSHQDAGFKESLPRQVRTQAVFKCVRVMAVDDGDDEYAYQAVVKIGGHVFKGLLYDQGVEGRDSYPNISELHLGGGGGGNVGSGSGAAAAAGRNRVSSSSPMMNPSDVYAGSSGGLLGGSSTYGNPIN